MRLYTGAVCLIKQKYGTLPAQLENYESEKETEDTGARTGPGEHFQGRVLALSTETHIISY